ncbi:MAG: CheR family methyltransferase [Woeseiaceae bacterium]
MTPYHNAIIVELQGNFSYSQAPAITETVMDEKMKTSAGKSDQEMRAAADAAAFPVIGVGASAGGLESIEKFFGGINNRCGAAFIVIQHLSPDFKSFMPEILSKKTTLQVMTAADGMHVQPNIIYLLPPRMNLVIEGSVLRLSSIERTRVPNKPIDLFFSSLARDAGERATAVVLSGTGSDGALGVRSILDAGGKVYVESLSSAKFDGMPSAVLATGVYDGEGTPYEIASEIFGVVADDADPSKIILKKELAGSHERLRIFKAIEDRYGVDFARYKIATVNRRIDRRMTELNVRTIEDYWLHIQEDPQEVTTLYYEMLIGVTEFFRDPEAFELLKTQIANIVESKDSGDEVRVWSAGCASGEEIYSLAILFSEEINKSGKKLNLKVFATDIDDEILGRAATGVYVKEQLKSVPDAWRSKYFSKYSGAYKVVPPLRSKVVFARHNVMNDPPFTKLDMITCRNLLIYLDNETQKQVLSLFYFSLKANGVLFLGPSESLGKYEAGYDAVDSKWKIFTKSERSLPRGAMGGDKQRQEREFPVLVHPDGARSQSAGLAARTVNDDAYQALLEQYVPPSLLTNEVQDLLHVYGDLPFKLTFKPGKASNNLRSFLDDSLCTALSVCIQRAKRERLSVEYKRFVIKSDDGATPIDFKVTPVIGKKAQHIDYFLVSFSDTVDAPAEDTPLKVISEKTIDLEQVSVLEEELKNTKEHLQATIEELETTNEELQSTNEELLASNEELQSTNEELHSVNEELYTVNAEYQSKISELNQLSMDEEHLFSNTGVGTIFIDSDRCIRKFTPAAASLFNLLIHDIGRPFDHVTHVFEGADFAPLMDRVLADEKQLERELVTEEGHHYIAQILPYRNDRGEPDGLVMSFVSIETVRNAEHLYQEIVESSPIGILGIAPDHTIVSMNSTFVEMSGVFMRDMIGRRLGELVPEDPDNAFAKVLRAYSDSEGQLDQLYDVTGTLQHRNGSKIPVEISLKQIETTDGEVLHLYVADRTEHHAYLNSLESDRESLQEELSMGAKALAQREADYEDLYENAPDMYGSVDPETAKLVKCNNRLAIVTGYKKSELLGMPIMDLYHEDSRADARAAFFQFRDTGQVRSKQLIILKKNGDPVPVLLNVDAVRGDDGEITQSRSTWIDVSNVYDLKKENKTFLLATQGSDLGIWDWDLVTGEQHWSPEFYALLGFTNGDAAALTFDSGIVHPADRVALTNRFEQHFKDEVPFDIECRLNMEDGDYHWFQLQGRAVREEDGRVIRMVGSARDIHEAREARDELKRQTEIHSFITEETNDGWWDWHLESNYEYMSPRFWETFGIDPSTKEHRPSEWQSLIHEKDLEKAVKKLAEHTESKGKRPYLLDARYRHADGHWVTVLCRGRVIEWGPNGEPIRMVGVHTDITMLKAQEAELQSMNIALQKSNEELERFAYIASHDLKAPLRGVSNLVDFIAEDIEPLLAHDEKSDSVRGHLRRLGLQTKRMQGLIQGVLDYSRLAGLQPVFDRVNVREMLGHISSDFQLALDEQLILPDSLPDIESDAVKLQQVFGNLISNASKFHEHPEDLKIQIGCEDVGDFFKYSVSDNGPGIEPRFHRKIFEMFETLQAKDAYESTGVGLTMVNRIVDQFGGTIDVESELGAGATFSFTWPKGPEALPQPN